MKNNRANVRNTMVCGAMLMSCLTFGAVEMRRTACDPTFLQSHYPILVQNELAIGQAFTKMAMYSGSTKVTNCVVEYPVLNNVPVEGNRRVMLDMQWYRIININGLKKEEFQQHGMEILYNRRRGPSGGHIREVFGLTVCRTPKLCKKKGIPFSLRNQPSTKPSLIPSTLPEEIPGIH